MFSMWQKGQAKCKVFKKCFQQDMFSKIKMTDFFFIWFLINTKIPFSCPYHL